MQLAAVPVVAVVEPEELLQFVVNLAVVEDNTADLAELQLSFDFLLDFQNTLHKLEVDSQAPERAVNHNP